MTVRLNNETRRGVGNGNLTLVHQFIDSDPANARETEFTYDFRDRQIVTKSPMPPHNVLAYDNLDRVVQRAMYSSAIPPTDPSIATDRVHYEETNYGQRGLVYRQAVETDPSAAAPSFLETHTWYDEVGRMIGTWSPTSVTTKRTFDGLGRSVVSYQTDRGGDAAPGAAGNYADVYDLGTHKANVTGDVVFQQTEPRYILPGGYPLDAYAGLVDLTTMRRRTHDATDTDTGDLADFSGPAAKRKIDTYAGIYYDVADRPIRSVNYGTNKNGFEYGGLAPTINQPASPDWDTTGPEIVVETTYKIRGLVDTRTTFGKEGTPNDEPLRTKFVYDDMNRRIAVIENQYDVLDDIFFGSDIEWNATTEQWEVTDGLDPDEPDKDRVTTFVYDGLGNVIKQVAHLSGASPGGEGSVQVTQYIYGVTLAGGSGRSSNDLLGQITYPDLGTTTFTYNRPAERSGMTDQNGTAHEFLRDDLGRKTLDRITTFGANIDQTVKATGIKYDNAGLTTFVTSYNVDNPNLVTPQPSEIVNEVEFTYTPLDQIQEIWQEPFGMVDRDGQGGDDSLRVSYSYSTSPFIGGSNHSRVLKLTYPDGLALIHSYGTTSSSHNRISRIRSLGLQNGGFFQQPLAKVKYDYIGLGMIAVVDYSRPDVQLDHTAAHNGKRQWNGYNNNPGVYSGLDRFGRNVRHMWVDGDFTVQNPQTFSPLNVGNRPPIVELASSYDKASSRLTSYDERPGVQQALSHQYAYDGLQRLDDAPRGSWINQVFTSGLYTQEWDLDMLGNSDEVRTELDGTPGYFGAGETDDRNHNASVNELDARDTGGQAGNEFTYSYDDAGNVERMDFVQTTTALVFTHDAWNRLVSVQFEDSQQILHDRAEYEYNGLNWRVIKRGDSDLTDGNNELDQQRIMYYSASWQLLEERIDDDGPTFADSPTSTDIDRHMQYAWGIRYIDDIYLHRQDTDKNGLYEETYYHLTDPQFSTVALIDGAVVAERVTYTAYGQGRHHWLFDVDGDGDVEMDDLLAIVALSGTPIGNSAYRSECDIDRSGKIDSDDWAAWSEEAALPFGLISDTSSGGVDNQIGYDGYVFNAETQEYLARNRFYEPELGRWLRRDPAGYVDGMNLYEYVGGRPIINTDPTGLAIDDDGACCVCEDDPSKCSIKVVHAFTFTSNANNVQVIMQVGAKVTLEHADGEDVTGCNLRQDTHGMANYDVSINDPRTTWISHSPPIAEWKTKKDYAPDVPNGAYHGHWYQDAPGMNLTWNHPKAQGLDIITYWWQAHVWVIESPTVETWWGFQITGRRTDEPQEGSTFWSAIRRSPFSTLPGHDKNFKGWGNELGSDF